MSIVIAIDPGNSKCGLLLVDICAEVVLDGKVVSQSSVLKLIHCWRSVWEINQIVIGNGTTSLRWQRLLSGVCEITVVEEKGSTLRARNRYWDLWPPSFFLKLLPRGLILPSDHLDAVAALILVEDYYGRKMRWTGEIDFKIWHEQ